jgi:hypothetical protein
VRGSGCGRVPPPQQPARSSHDQAFIGCGALVRNVEQFQDYTNHARGN